MKTRQKYNLYYHGKNKYGKEWPQVRARVLLRDGKKCRMCEASKGLHIHHIIAFKISHSNSDINLVTLCRTCHPTIEAVMWKLLEEGAHRFQIYRAAWEYIKVTHDKLLLELKKN